MDPKSTTQACTSLNKKLTQLSLPQSESAIYRVHRHLRNVNPKAYEPEVIAIGPYHRGKDHLKMMEDQKLRYLQLLKSKRSNIVETYVAAVGQLESQARKCYADEPINLSASELIEMLVLDGCFIIELVRKFIVPSLREKNDPIFQMNWMINSLQRDLMLFENQVPFFVLCKLFDLIEVPNQHMRLWWLLSEFFSSLYPGNGRIEGAEVVAPDEVKHLLDFIHRSWLPPLRRGTDLRGRKTTTEIKGLRFTNNATRLKEANVKFERKERVPLFDILFNNGVLFMAPLTIEDRTECFFRNLIAHEQYSKHNLVTDYVKFLDCLVDSSKDVEVLSRNGIIENWLGDEEVVAKMVNKLADSVAGPGDLFVYDEISENVNKHCRKH